MFKMNTSTLKAVPLALLLLLATISGCSDLWATNTSESCPDSAPDAGSMPAAGMCIQGAQVPCLDCMNAHCCGQYTACINAPDKNEGVQCVDEAGCWLGVNACPAMPLLPDTQGLAACLNVSCAGVCSAPPGGHRAPRREPIGTAAEPMCMSPMPPVLQGLTTTKLRAIAAFVGIGAGQSGIQQSRSIGLAFENWVLVTLGLPKWKTMIPSPARKANTGGLPAAVIPDAVTSLTLFSTNTGMSVFPNSELWEVKAVTGALLPQSSNWQILGFLDVARLSAAGTSTMAQHPLPVIAFTTTYNTTIDPTVLTQATQWGVAVWQEVVFYDATDPNDQNPDLWLGPLVALNQDVYPAGGVPIPAVLKWTPSKLSSPTTPPVVIPNDPDPPEVM